jgi:hypothetical protein
MEADVRIVYTTLPNPNVGEFALRACIVTIDRLLLIGPMKLNRVKQFEFGRNDWRTAYFETNQQMPFAFTSGGLSFLLLLKLSK